jgi:lipoate-protein ligase A
MIWRFLDTGVQGAAFNMAIDEALLLLCDEQPKVTLRFYGWARPTLSLGYFQGVAGVGLEECARRGFDWVRRPTGGRAVLHDHELTYSVVAPIEILGASVSRSHERINRALARGLEKLGLHAEFVQSRASVKEASAACFAAPAMVGLTVQGKKVIGSAQMRTKKSLLQHGSIPITIDFEALAAVLKLPAAARLLRQKAAGLAEFLAREPTITELKQVLIKGFEEIFEAEFRAEGLSSPERALAERLCEKYSTCAWNRRV